jgi:(S)-ureidoglycine aminohydrolase
MPMSAMHLGAVTFTSIVLFVILLKMKKLFCTVVLFVSVSALAQQDSIRSGVYLWKNPVKNKLMIASSVLFEGSTHDMEWLQMTSNVIAFSNRQIRIKVPPDQEQLLIVKSGDLIIAKDSTYSLSGGSVALFMPGETYVLQNKSKESSSYYLMKYRSKTRVDMGRADKAGGSLIKEWNKIEFKPNGNGGRRDFFQRATAMCPRFEMHVTTLKASLKSHEPHTHPAQEIILVLEGNTEMLIGDKQFKGDKGSVYYLGSNVLHGICNVGSGECTYFAFQFE